MKERITFCYWRKKTLVMGITVLCTVVLSLTGCALPFTTQQSGAFTKAVKKGEGSFTSVQCPRVTLPTTATGYWPLDEHDFKGIYQFLGQSHLENVNNPNIAGSNLEWSWAKIETSEGVYDWSRVDKDINAWTSKGKSVILRFSTGGQKSWSGTVNGSYTPSWVFDTYEVPRVTEINGTIFPVYWNPIYLQKLTDFVNAAAARYDNNPHIAAVEIGIGQGGETEPDGGASGNPNGLQLWEHYGYTNALWFQTIQKITTIYENAWKHTPLAIMATSTFLHYERGQYDRYLVEKYALKEGVWIQINALADTMAANVLQNQAGQITTTVEEQRQSAGQSGYPLMHDVKHGLNLGARYILVFTNDLIDPANADAITYGARHVTTSAISDCSGHAITLTSSGRVSPTNGASNKPGDLSQLFDGSTGTLDSTKSAIDQTNRWSVEGWVYPTSLPQTEALAVMNGADGLNAGGFGFGIGGAKGGTGSQLVGYLPGVGWIDSGYTFTSTRTWYHVVMMRDGNMISFSVNGQKTARTSLAKPNPIPLHFSIGSGYDLSSSIPTHFFTGAIDEVKTYSDVVSG